jgi:hypothetical protein
MTQEDMAYRFGAELRQLLTHYRNEYPDMLVCSQVGILKMLTDYLSIEMNDSIVHKKDVDKRLGG